MFSKEELEILHTSIKQLYVKEAAKSKALPQGLKRDERELHDIKELMNKVGSLIIKCY